MPGMNERKRHMRGETKTARGDYGTKGYMGGGKIPGYKHGGGVKIMPNYGTVSSSISKSKKPKKKNLRRR